MRWRVLWWVMWVAMASACAGPAPAPTPTAPPPQLRIRNSGAVDIVGLVVLFPGPTADALARRVTFGTVPAGATTDYQAVPAGVYRYAAYEYQLDGRGVSQPVIDWVGESPLAGRQFTYQIELDLQKQPGDQVQLIAARTDEP